MPSIPSRSSKASSPSYSNPINPSSSPAYLSYYSDSLSVSKPIYSVNTGRCLFSKFQAGHNIILIHSRE